MSIQPRPTQAVVMMKPHLYPHATDEAKMGLYCKGRLVRYTAWGSVAEWGDLTVGTAEDIAAYRGALPALALKFPWRIARRCSAR